MRVGNSSENLQSSHAESSTPNQQLSLQGRAVQLLDHDELLKNNETESKVLKVSEPIPHPDKSHLSNDKFSHKAEVSEGEDSEKITDFASEKLLNNKKITDTDSTIQNNGESQETETGSYVIKELSDLDFNNLSELSIDELMAMAAELDLEDLQIDSEQQETFAQIDEKTSSIDPEATIESEKNSFESEAQNVNETTHQINEKSTESSATQIHKENLQQTNINLKKDNVNLKEDSVSIKEDIINLKVENKKSLSTLKAEFESMSKDDPKYHDAGLKVAKEMMRQNVEKHADPEIARINKQVLAEIEKQEANGVSSQQIMHGIVNPANGKALDEMDLDEFYDALENIHTMNFTFAPWLNAQPKSTEEDEKHDKDSTVTNTKEPPKKNEAPREEKATFLKEQQFVQANLTSEKNKDMEHAKQKLEQQCQGRLATLYEQRMTKEHIDTSVKNEIKILEYVKHTTDEMSVPVRKEETIAKFSAVLHVLQNIPNDKKSGELKLIQNTLISFYKEIKSAVGVEVVSGTGKAPRVNVSGK